MVFVLMKSTFRFYKRRTGIVVIDNFFFYFFVGRRHFNGTYRQHLVPENSHQSFNKSVVGRDEPVSACRRMGVWA